METIDDSYPSRNGNHCRLLPRQDPVVYQGRSGPLSAQALQQYERDGFLVLRDLFSEQEVGRLIDEADQLKGHYAHSTRDDVYNEADSGDVRSIFAVHHRHALFERLSQDERLVSVAEQLLNDQVYVHQSRINYKPAFRGKEFYWHSDFETWHVEDGMPRMRALSMSVMLTDNYLYNGPLMLIPGSHNTYISCEGVTPENHHARSLVKQELGVPTDAALQHLVTDSEIVTSQAEKGSVLVFDCNVMHGSASNISPHPRSNVFMVYNAISNRIIEPYCGLAPRPEYIATRRSISPITTHNRGLV